MAGFRRPPPEKWVTSARGSLKSMLATECCGKEGIDPVDGAKFYCTVPGNIPHRWHQCYGLWGYHAGNAEPPLVLIFEWENGEYQPPGEVPTSKYDYSFDEWDMLPDAKENELHSLPTWQQLNKRERR